MRLKNFAIILVLGAISVSFNAAAQSFTKVDKDGREFEDYNRDANGKIIRGAYLTNEWYDNWVFGLSGGVQTLIAPQNDGIGFTPQVEFDVTKWVTPSIAARLGIYGGPLKEKRPAEYLPNHSQLVNIDGYNMFRQTFGFHVDLMWSLSNAFGGYKESRLWNFTPYISGGYLRLADSQNPFFAVQSEMPYYFDREFTFSVGLLNKIRLTNHLSATIDLRDNGFGTSYHTVGKGVGLAHNLSATAGLAYTIHKWYWDRHATSVRGYKSDIASANAALDAVRDQNAKLAREKDELAREKDALAGQNSLLQQQAAAAAAAGKDKSFAAYLAERELANNPGDELLIRILKAGCVLFYEINKDTLNETESLHLMQYVQEMHEIDPNHVFYLTGSADEGTGNFKINSRLSKNRAENVKKVLMRKYGIPESQIVIKTPIISNSHEDGRLDRCVLIEDE